MVRRSSQKAAIGFLNCEVSSNADFLQLLGAVKKSNSAEYPYSPTRQKDLQMQVFFVLYNKETQVKTRRTTALASAVF